MSALHPSLTAGRWYQMTLLEQLGNIGSEVHRCAQWQNKNDERFENAFVRTLELMDLTLNDPRWRQRLKELGRLREVLCDAYHGSQLYHTTFGNLHDYFLRFGVGARLHSR